MSFARTGTAFLLLTLAPCAHAAEKDWRITPYGYGPIKAGMTLGEAERAGGVKLVGEPDPNIPECYHAFIAGKKDGVAFMVQKNKITRVSLYESLRPLKTDKGIGVGDSEKKVLAAYGNALAIEPHQYGDADDRYLTYWLKDKTHGIRYETVDGVVVDIHGGDTSIQLIEGCL